MSQADPFKSQLVDAIEGYLSGRLVNPDAIDASDLRMMLDAFEDMQEFIHYLKNANVVPEGVAPMTESKAYEIAAQCLKLIEHEVDPSKLQTTTDYVVRALMPVAEAKTNGDW